jgi:hypothetical protein
MPKSEAAVQVAPSKGKTQVQDVAVQVLFVLMFVPIRFETNVAGSAHAFPVQEQVMAVSAGIV